MAGGTGAAFPFAGGVIRRRSIGTIVLAPLGIASIAFIRNPGALPVFWPFVTSPLVLGTKNFSAWQLPGPLPQSFNYFFEHAAGFGTDAYAVTMTNNWEDPVLTFIPATIEFAILEFQP